MALDQDEYEEVGKILTAAVGNNALSDWQRQFASDMNDKYEEYGMDMLVSSKQWDKLREIWERC